MICECTTRRRCPEGELSRLGCSVTFRSVSSMTQVQRALCSSQTVMLPSGSSYINKAEDVNCCRCSLRAARFAELLARRLMVRANRAACIVCSTFCQSECLDVSTLVFSLSLVFSNSLTTLFSSRFRKLALPVARLQLSTSLRSRHRARPCMAPMLFTSRLSFSFRRPRSMTAILTPFRSYQGRDISSWKTWPDALRDLAPKKDVARTITDSSNAQLALQELHGARTV